MSTDVPKLESRGQSAQVLEDVLVARWNDADSVDALFARHGDQIAAVIAEPILGNSGVILPEPGFLSRLRDIAHSHGSLVIFDEVITGYRVGLSGASGRLGVTPDLVVLGKAIANGYPLSVILGRPEILDLGAGGGVVHAGTFNGNPMVLAAALATLTELEAQGTLEKIERNAMALAEGLKAELDGRKVTASVHQVGGIVQILPGVTRVRDYDGYATASWAWYDSLIVELLKRGVFVLPGGRLYLSAAHSKDDIASTLQAFSEALEQIACLPTHP